MANGQLKAASPTTVELTMSQERKTCVLVVEDDPTMLMIIESMLGEMGYDVLTAENGRLACTIIERDSEGIDIILLDRVMPEMDGMEVVKRLKKDLKLKRIPIIMQTGSDKPEQIKEGIDAGVFYYLTKPFKGEVLQSVVEAAVREAHQQKTLRNEMRKHRTSFNLLKSASFTYSTLEEAENLSCFIANCFPEPDRVLAGLAELLINAVEHGNLQIGYELKTKLVAEGKWREEIEKRQSDPQYAGKTAEIMLIRREGSVAVRITDQGEGFDWQDYLHIDPSRAADNHGRGIARANVISFDELKFNTHGNQVTASVRLEEELEW